MIRLQVLGALGLAGADGQEIRPLLAQPKRLALFVYLVLGAPAGGFLRRDTIVALFWPELSGEAARAALRRSLHFLRQHLGEGIIVSRGEDEVGIAAAQVVCDALGFDRDLAAGREADAVTAYHGDLLTGLFVADVSPDLEEWIDQTRRRYRERAATAAGRLSEREEAQGQRSTARFWAQRALDLQPLSEPSLVRMLRLLDAAGERAEALNLADAFTRRLDAELGVEPGPEVRSAVLDLRARRPTPAAKPGLTPGLTELAPSPGPTPTVRRSRRLWPIAAAAVIVFGGAASLLARRRPAGTPVLAVGAMVPEGGADSSGVGATLPDLLATALANLPDVQVVTRARLYEVAGELGERGLTPAALLRAAKQAGADRLVEGEVYAQPDGWRLDLRLVDLASGAVRRAWVVRAGGPFALADSATLRLAAELRRPAPTGGAAEASSASLVARRYFDDGLRAYARRDWTTADALFGLALNEDPEFPLALYYASRTRNQLSSPPEGTFALARRAHEAARAHGSRYERLLLATWWAELNQSPAGLALADSLVAAFPYEPEAYVLAGDEHSYAADYPGAVRIYAQLAALDSQSLATGGPWCRACVALSGIAGGYEGMDSLERSLEYQRRAGRAQPRNRAPWEAQIYLLSALGHDSAALALLDAGADSLDVSPAVIVHTRAWLALHTGDWPAADRAIAALEAQSGESHHTALWIKTIRDRMRGQLGPALEAARQYEHSGQPIPRGVVLFELGQYRAAAALWNGLRLPWDVGDTTSGYNARQFSWMLTHEITALDGAGDTSRIVLLVDTLERVGRWSSYARDRRMHHYARGLLWDARGRPDDAVREYRQAMTSPIYGYSRIHYRLARDLIALGRAAEAIPVLRGALHGGLESTNLYVTHTELHELLARAYDATGQRADAAQQYRWVARAWAVGEPPFRERGAAAARRAAQLAP